MENGFIRMATDASEFLLRLDNILQCERLSKIIRKAQIDIAEEVRLERLELSKTDGQMSLLLGLPSAEEHP